MEPVAAPGVVAEHHDGLRRADDPGDLPTLVHPVVQLPVHPAEEQNPVATGRRGGVPSITAAAARLSSMRAATSSPRSASGSQLPLDPSVRTRWWMRHPAAAHLARVAPQPNSMSSGWAPMASADAGTSMSTVTGPPVEARSPTGSPLSGPAAAASVPLPVTAAARPQTPPARRRPARRRPKPGRDGRGPARAAPAVRPRPDGGRRNPGRRRSGNRHRPAGR